MAAKVASGNNKVFQNVRNILQKTFDNKNYKKV